MNAAAAVTEPQKVERSYKRMLALTDEVLSRLEQRNLAGQRDLDPVMRRNIARAVETISTCAGSLYRRFGNDLRNCRKQRDAEDR